jgi:hypothetical protein
MQSGGIYNEPAKSLTSLCSANTLGGIYNELAKSTTPGSATN